MNAHTFFVILETLWSFAVRSWSAVGPLVGVLIGAWLTRSWQRKQWELDSRKAEYRELISTLSESFHQIATYQRFNMQPPEVRQKISEAEVAGQSVIADRIFIEKQLRMRQVSEHWDSLIAERDLPRLWTRWTELHDALVRMAHRDLEIKEK
jgi:hypothetical protein